VSATTELADNGDSPDLNKDERSLVAESVQPPPNTACKAVQRLVARGVPQSLDGMSSSPRSTRGEMSIQVIDNGRKYFLTLHLVKEKA
jgi:hypothetical protein